MKLTELRWTPYAVPFVAAFTTSERRWSVRAGIVLTMVTDAGVSGVGDVTPLPSHGTAPHAALLRALEVIAPRLIGSEITQVAQVAQELLGNSSRYAPLVCGFELAACAAEGSAAGVSVARLLSPHAASSVMVNAVVDAGTCADSTAAAVRAVRRGFRSVKLKVGLGGCIADEVARVAALREAVGPAVRVTLDANGAWTEQEAVETLLAVEPYDIGMVEQPVGAGDIGALRRVRDAVRIPVAADESVTGIASVRALVGARAVDGVVVKLPVVGGPRSALRIMTIAADAGVAVTVTSALESGIGIAGALHAAASLPEPMLACGLATLDLLEDDLILEGLPIRDGQMAVPHLAGLGVTLDEEAVSRFATGAERVVRA